MDAHGGIIRGDLSKKTELKAKQYTFIPINNLLE
jgi:hypothetical protein